VPAAAESRQLSQHYHDRIQLALEYLGRPDTHVRFVATGYSDEDDEDE